MSFNKSRGIKNRNKVMTSLLAIHRDKLNTQPQYTPPKNKKTPVPMKSLRNKAYRDVTTNDKLKSAVGTTLGTVIPMLFMMKKQGVKNPFKLEYGIKEMVILSATSIIGAVGLGLVKEDKETRINRINEGVFQFSNATIPTVMVWGGLKLCENVKKMNNVPAKIGITLVALVTGMKIAAVATNKICDPQDLKPDRKHDLKDTIANADDLFGALVLAKVPFVEKLKLDKFLPAIYAYCGYRAGKTN